jgi:hypothetical protein
MQSKGYLAMIYCIACGQPDRTGAADWLCWPCYTVAVRTVAHETTALRQWAERRQGGLTRARTAEEDHLGLLFASKPAPAPAPTPSHAPTPAPKPSRSGLNLFSRGT